MEDAELEALAVEPDPEMDKAVCDCLYRILPMLRKDYSEIIWRADLLSEPRERIAASLGTTVNNVTVRLHRGRQALRKHLEQMCQTCPIHGFLDCRCDFGDHMRKARQTAQKAIAHKDRSAAASIPRNGGKSNSSAAAQTSKPTRGVRP